MTTASDRYLVRPGRPCDAAELAALQASVQLSASTDGTPDAGIAAWVEDLLDGHPSVRHDDFVVAEEIATGRLVASLVGLRQDWSLAGVRLPVAQIELVGTLPAHRGNRLTERLFTTLHQRYTTDGVPVQMIEGIPYFYRRLGYDYALANDGAPTVSATALPANGQDQPTGGLTMRPATVTDADALADLDRSLADSTTLTCPRDAATWRYEIAGRRPTATARRTVAVLARDTHVLGYLVHGVRLSATGELIVVAAACPPNQWPQAAPAMHTYLGRTGRQHEASQGRPFTGVRPILDPRHPLILLTPPGAPQRPRGWYVRTGDPCDLLARLRPVLRERWRAANLHWPEATLTIDTYGHAARLTFTDGHLTAVTAVRGAVSPPTDPATHAAIPPTALLQLALGHRSLPDVLNLWPDCLLRDRRTEHFLTAAFPTVPVHVWPRN
ncbi:GNAT family N-acetyltransferase [Micromonospora sp. NPDC002389]|uniref:GNAT family N-acetyltransferase n=1 Tax=Micromonospora sp. NPDC002389 TaxID=3154272 RepID=UPI003324A5FA